MVLEFLDRLKAVVTEAQFKVILDVTTQDIMFNRVKFGKKTSQREFIKICGNVTEVILRYN